MGVKTNLGLSPDAAALLEQVDGKGDMVSTLVVETHARALAALRYLEREAKWPRPAILAACECCMGWWREFFTPPSWLAQELADGESLNGIAAKWGVAEEWPRLIGALDERTTAALLCVSDQFWAGDSEIERRLRKEVK